MRSIWLLLAITLLSAFLAAAVVVERAPSVSSCCECLVQASCTDLATDTCESTLRVPRAESGGAPWRYHSLLGGDDDAAACATFDRFTDFDEERGGCGSVCSAFVF